VWSEWSTYVSILALVGLNLGNLIQNILRYSGYEQEWSHSLLAFYLDLGTSELFKDPSDLRIINGVLD
jgi:uncharacterized membrane protein